VKEEKTVSATGTDGIPASSDGRRAALGGFLRKAAAIAMVVGWCWAIGMAFVPITIGAGDYSLHCGVPAAFDNSAYVNADADNYPGQTDTNDIVQDRDAEQCDAAATSRIGGTVGLMAVTAPITALWLVLRARWPAPAGRGDDEIWPTTIPD
jgi:hypothetical protein